MVVLEAGRRWRAGGAAAHELAPAPVPLLAAARLPRDPAADAARRRARPLRGGRRRRLARVREHAGRAARAVLRRPAVGGDSRDWRDGARAATIATGAADARRRTRSGGHAGRRASCARSRGGWASRTPYRPTDVAVFFGEPGVAVADPFFGGAGPARRGCIALRRLHDRLPPTGRRTRSTATTSGSPSASGVEIRAEREVQCLRRRSTEAAGSSSARRPGAWVRRRRRGRPGRTRSSSPRASSARVRLLLRCGGLPADVAARSARPSARTRRRSSARARRAPARPLRAASRSRRRSSPTPETHVQPVRYGPGSNADGAARARSSSTAAAGCRAPLRFAAQVAAASGACFAAQPLRPALVRADGDPARDAGARQPPAPDAPTRPAPLRRAEHPDLPPAGERGGAARRRPCSAAIPASSLNEVLLDRPDDRAPPRRLPASAPRRRTASSTRTTASSGSPACTSSTARPCAANLGANPSLTITAMAERALSLWPRRGEPDTRDRRCARQRRGATGARRAPGGSRCRPCVPPRMEHPPAASARG